MPYCRNCGSKIEEDVNYCPVCGNPTYSAIGKQSTSHPPISNPIEGHVTSILRYTFYAFVVMTFLLIITTDSDDYSDRSLILVILSCIGPYAIYRGWKDNHKFDAIHYLLLIPPILMISFMLWLLTLVQYDNCPRLIFILLYYFVPIAIYIALPIWLKSVKDRNP